MTDYVTTSEAGEILGLTPQSVGRLCKNGILPYLPVGKRGILIKRTDLNKALNRPKPGNPNWKKRKR